jgi:hypothetical protein
MFRCGTSKLKGSLRVMAGLLITWPLVAFAVGKPPAPQVTVGAEIKQLRFDWEPVKRAAYYRVWYKAGAQSDYVAIGALIPASSTTASVPVAAHLHDWVNARYRIAACNTKGCRYSAEIAVTDLATDVVGYFKADSPLLNDNFGWSIDASEDGSTLLATSHEDVDGVYLSGVAYVFERSNGEWIQRARLLPSLLQAGAGYDADVAVSRNGNVIVIGRRSEDIPNSDPEEFGDVGAVYIFERSGGTWTQTAKLQADTQLNGESFGARVQLNIEGTILAVHRRTGGPSGVIGAGTVVMYQKQGASWVQSATLPYTQNNVSCPGMALSGDGAVLVKSCVTFSLSPSVHKLHVYSGPGWSTETTITLDPPPPYSPFGAVALDHDGETIVAQSWTGYQPKAVVYRLNAGTYALDAQFLPGAWQVNEFPLLHNEFANSLAVSRDGNIVAVSDAKDTGIGTGFTQPPLVAGEPIGAVHVYQRRGGEWTQRSLIKPNHTPVTFSQFGTAVDLARNGKLLLVGDPWASGGATGVGGDQTDTSVPYSGAMWLY